MPDFQKQRHSRRVSFPYVPGGLLRGGCEANVERNREMIGSMHVADHAGIIELHRSLYEHPIQSADHDVGPLAAIAKTAPVAGFIEALDDGRMAAEGIEIAGNDHGC